MIIYEVNLLIHKDIFAIFQQWLKSHVQLMLKIPGFIQAEILKSIRQTTDDYEALIVQYKIESQQALEHYFLHFANLMRQEAIDQFGDKFSAERRILILQDLIIADK